MLWSKSASAALMLLSCLVAISDCVVAQPPQPPPGDEDNLWVGRPAWVNDAIDRSRRRKAIPQNRLMICCNWLDTELAPEAICQVIYQESYEVDPSVALAECLKRTFVGRGASFAQLYDDWLSFRRLDGDVLNDLIVAEKEARKDLQALAIDELRRREFERAKDFSDRMHRLLSHQEQRTFWGEQARRYPSRAMDSIYLTDELQLTPQQREDLDAVQRQLTKSLAAKIDQPDHVRHRVESQMLGKRLQIMEPSQLRAYFTLRGDLHGAEPLRVLCDRVKPWMKAAVDQATAPNADDHRKPGQ